MNSTMFATALLAVGILCGCTVTPKSPPSVKVDALSVGLYYDVVGVCGVSLGTVFEIEGVFMKSVGESMSGQDRYYLFITAINDQKLEKPIEMSTDEETGLLKQFTGQHFRLLVIEWARFEPIADFNSRSAVPDQNWKPKIDKIGDRFWSQQMSLYLHIVSDLRHMPSKPAEPNQALVPTVMSVTPAADAPVAPAKTAAHL